MRQRALLNNIQCLRAVAAYMVVVYHARLLTPIGEYVSFEFGNAGVDIFFFISGFIINHVGGRDDVGAPGAFLLKRAIRIIPLYWLLTVLVGAAGQVAPSLAGAGGRPDVMRIVQSLFFVPYYDDTGEMHPVLFMGWTLNFEIFFYVLFAAALLIRDETRRLATLTIGLIALVAVGVLFDPHGAAGTTYTSPLLLEFVVGMWMNRVWRGWPERPLTTGMRAMLGVAIALAFVMLAVGDVAWPTITREVKWGVPAFVIVAAALALERGGVSLRWRWLLLLGEASFAIYLIHPFVIKAATIAYRRAGVSAMPLHVLALIAVLALVGAVGVAFHLLVERPLIRGLRHRLTPRAPASAAAGEIPPTRGGAADIVPK